MSFSGSAMTIAVALKLADQFSTPLREVVDKAKTAFDGLSRAGAELEKIKLFDTAKKELEALGKQLEAAKKERDFFVESAAKGGDAGAKMFGQDVAAAKEEVLKLAAAVEKKTRALDDAGQALRDAGVDMDHLGDRVSALSGRVEREARFDKLASDLRKVADSARAVGEKLESVGRQSVATGAAIGAGVGKTVTSFADQESALARLKAAMSTEDGLSENFERVQALTIELGNRLPGNTADFANMATALMQLGVSDEAILGGVGKAAANLAVVMRLPYEEAAEIAAKLKKATGTAEEDMLRFMDVIQRTGSQGVKSGEMMLAFARSAGALQQYNIQGVEESQKLAAVYAQLIQSGASGETVGTGMAAILGRLREFDAGSTKNAKDAAESLKSLGINMDFFDDKTGEFKGVDNLIAQLDKLKDLDPQRMADVFSKIAGTGQDSQFMAQLAMSGTAGNQAMKDRMAGGANINTKVDIELSTLAAKWEAATGTFTNLLAAMGSTMAPKLGAIVEWFNKISEAGIKLVNENKELFGWLGMGAAVVAGTLVTGGALALSLGTVARLFGGITEGMAVLAKIGPVLGGVTDALVKWGPQLAGGLKTVGAATSAVIKAHPVLAAIFGAVAIGFLVYDNRKAIGAGIAAIVDGITQLFAAITGKFKDIGGQMMAGLMEGIQDGLRWVQSALRKVGMDLPDSLKKVLDIRSPSRVFMAIGQEIGAGLVIGIAGSAEAVREAVKGLGDVAIYAGDEATMAMIREQEVAMAEMKGTTPAAPAKPLEIAIVDDQRYRRPDGKFGESSIGDEIKDLQEKHGPFAAAMLEYQRTVGAVGDNMRQAFGRAFKGMEDALVNFVKTGKLNFKDLARSIIDDLIRIQIQQSITKPLASAMQSFDFSSLKFWADGGVPGGPSVSAWRNQVVNQPTLFAFANGAGVMGEAGPEAIMPLTRGADGRLGVQAQGGAGNVTIEQHITVDARGADAGVEQKIYLAMQRAKQEAVAAVADSFRRGGPMARAVRMA